MSDPRIHVLLDLLAELGEGDPARGLASAMAAYPKLWLGVPRRAQVALPWAEPPHGVHGQDLAYRWAALTGDGYAARLYRAGDKYGIDIPVDVTGMLDPRTMAGVMPRLFDTLEETRELADQILTERGWVLL